MFPDVSCTIADMEKQDWERLGRRIVHRRVELGMRTREQFAERTELSTRLLQDLENGKRMSYSSGTLAVVERALNWEAGSARDILFGMPPREIEPAFTPDPPTVESPQGGVTNRSMARLLIASGRAKDAADAAAAAGSRETDLIERTVEAYEAMATVAVEHFGGHGQMTDLANALQSAQRVALRQSATTNYEGIHHEDESAQAASADPQVVGADGDSGTPKTGAVLSDGDLTGIPSATLDTPRDDEIPR